MRKAGKIPFRIAEYLSLIAAFSLVLFALTLSVVQALRLSSEINPNISPRRYFVAQNVELWYELA